MPVVRAHLRHPAETHVPLPGWPDDCHVQWGRGRMARDDEGQEFRINAFFEAFPAVGGVIRGEGETLEDAEASALARFSRESTCEHAWSRKFSHTLGQCRLCNARQPVFNPIVTLGGWKAPLTGIELSYTFNGFLEPVIRPGGTGGRDVHARRIWLRFRLNGLDLPDIPDEPKDILEDTDFGRECQEVILGAIHEQGGEAAIGRGLLEHDGKVIAILDVNVTYELRRAYTRWLPDHQQALTESEGPQP